MFDSLRSRIGKMPAVPLCFLGVGFYRAFTETLYFNGSLNFPTQVYASSVAYDVLNIIFLLAVALFSRKLAPLSTKKTVWWVTILAMLASIVMNFASIYYPEYASMLAWPAVACASVGMSMIILLWSEFFGCINPFRVGLYYSGSVILGAAVLWLFKGLIFEWLFVCSLLLPIASLVCLKRSFSTLSASELPHAGWGAFTFPWKPILVVTLYSFAYGMRNTIFTDVLSLHSAFGVAFAGIFIYLALSLFIEDFEFSFIWKLACPLMIISLVSFESFLPFGEEIADFCALVSYTLSLILIMVILSNLSYRYGVCAIWIFGIERATRLIAVLAGTKAQSLIAAWSLPIVGRIVLSIAVVVLVVVATLFFFSEKQLSSPWGTVLKGTPAMADGSSELHRLSVKCQELAKQCGLSSREEEILWLMVQKKKISIIERELFIAQSTVKTHIHHIYEKTGVHSRKELFALLGIVEAQVS